MPYEMILVDAKERVGLITLNRPKQLNALSPQLMQELGKALYEFDADEGIGAASLGGEDTARARRWSRSPPTSTHTFGTASDSPRSSILVTTPKEKLHSWPH